MVGYLQLQARLRLKLGDPPEGAHDGAGGAPLAVAAVLASTQQVLAPAVVGVLVEDPVAIHHIAGVDVAVVEAVRHAGAVVHELHHVAAEVGLLVDPHPVGAAVLGRPQGGDTSRRVKGYYDFIIGPENGIRVVIVYFIGPKHVL